MIMNAIFSTSNNDTSCEWCIEMGDIKKITIHSNVLSEWNNHINGLESPLIQGTSTIITTHKGYLTLRCFSLYPSPHTHNNLKGLNYVVGINKMRQFTLK